MDLHLTPSKHGMRLRSQGSLDNIVANQSPTYNHYFHDHPHSPPQTTTQHTTHFKSRLRSASAPNLISKRRSERFSHNASKKKLRGPITGNPDDLEDWELDDPIVRRLAAAVLAIREERKVTMERLEAIDQKIDTLRRGLVEKDGA